MRNQKRKDSGVKKENRKKTIAAATLPITVMNTPVWYCCTTLFFDFCSIDPALFRFSNSKDSESRMNTKLRMQKNFPVVSSTLGCS